MGEPQGAPGWFPANDNPQDKATFDMAITVPDGLGGWHAVQVVQNGQIRAQVSYYVKRSFVSMPKTVKAGEYLADNWSKVIS